MAQWGKALATSPDDLRGSSLQEPHDGKRTNFQKLSSDLHMYPKSKKKKQKILRRYKEHSAIKNINCSYREPGFNS